MLRSKITSVIAIVQAVFTGAVHVDMVWKKELLGDPRQNPDDGLSLSLIYSHTNADVTGSTRNHVKGRERKINTTLSQ